MRAESAQVAAGGKQITAIDNRGSQAQEKRMDSGCNRVEHAQGGVLPLFAPAAGQPKRKTSVMNPLQNEFSLCCRAS